MPNPQQSRPKHYRQIMMIFSVLSLVIAKKLQLLRKPIKKTISISFQRALKKVRKNLKGQNRFLTVLGLNQLLARTITT
jgi:hypothetical protein